MSSSTHLDLKQDQSSIEDESGVSSNLPLTALEGVGSITNEEESATNDHETPADKVLNIEAFLRSLEHGRVFTQQMLRHAAHQLQNAEEGKDVELIDCYGNHTTISCEDAVAAGYVNGPYPPRMRRY